MIGLVLTKLIRNMPQTSDATLIAVTDIVKVVNSRSALKPGFDRHMVKPADMGSSADFSLPYANGVGPG
jgi:CheY-like chemotaxis protein